MTRYHIYRCVVLILTIVGMSMGAIAQTAETDKMSAFVRKALKESWGQSLRRDSPHDSRDILAFVKVSEGTEVFKKYGCQTYAQWGDIHIARIPLKNLAALSAETQVKRIEAHASAHQLLDTATTIINALPVYEASPTHRAYTGEGVVMGLMDIGFDLTHPNFYNRDLTHTRIRAFWDQLSTDTIGSAFPLGRDYIGEEAVLDAQGREDRKVWVGIRPEGFIPDENGPFTCKMDRVEVMGRDVSVVSTHEKMTGKSIRSIVSAENKFRPDQTEVKFSLKPYKVFLFDRESEERV